MGLGRQCQLTDPALGRKARRAGNVAAPVQLELLHQTLGRQPPETVVHSGIEGQAVGNLADGGQVQAVGHQAALCALLALGVLQIELHIATGPVQAVAGGKGQRLAADFPPAGQQAQAQAAAHLFQLQRLQLGCQFDGDGLQRQIGGGPGDGGVVHIDPGAQRSRALAQVHAQVHIVAQLLQVHLLGLCKQLATPVAPVAGTGGEQRLLEPPQHRQAAAPARWRVGIHAHAVHAVAVANQHIHVGQLQHRQAAQLVAPAHPATAHHQLGLGKHPVGSTTAIGPGIGQGKAGNPDTAVGGAAHIQFGRSNVELLKPQADGRAHRERRQHRGQAQGLAALCVQQAHIAQFHRRDQAVGSGQNVAHAHGNAHALAGLLFQPRTEFADSRHNQKMQSAPEQA